MESATLPKGILQQYESNFQRLSETVTFEEDDCIPWNGPRLMPRREGQVGLPAILDPESNMIYDAAKVGYCIVNETSEYPLSWYAMTCRNIWCVHGRHVTLQDRTSSGRRGKSLEETKNFDKRRAEITTYLAHHPDATMDEVVLHLKSKTLNGKFQTISRIITRVRHDLGLPGRVVRKRAKA